MKKNKRKMSVEDFGFVVTMGLTLSSFASIVSFGVLSYKSYNHVESDDELEKRSQFEYFGYYDKNIELPKDKLLERQYKNDNTISEQYHDLFFWLMIGSMGLFFVSFITFGYFADCKGL